MTAIVIIFDTIKHFSATENPDWTMRDSLTFVLERYDTGYNLTPEAYNDILADCEKYADKYIS